MPWIDEPEWIGKDGPVETGLPQVDPLDLVPWWPFPSVQVLEREGDLTQGIPDLSGISAPSLALGAWYGGVLFAAGVGLGIASAWMRSRRG